MLTNEKLNFYETIPNKLLGYKDLLDEEIFEEMEIFSKGFRGKIEDTRKKDRLLRIGIVGEVKAGKSSFLNALLFNGEQILPQAATPMTAALTKIVYSDELKAEVEFYTKEDWELVQKYANKYEILKNKYREEFLSSKETKKNPFAKFNRENRQQNMDANINNSVNEKEIQKYIARKMPNNIKGCFELVSMFNSSKEGASELYNCIVEEKRVISGVNSIKDLMGRLEAYVGAKGGYTPIVKSSTIYINIPTIEGLEIIDTPGTNDPIVSRSIATTQNLRICDAVFLLSYAGQFMTKQDLDFILNKLPESGIQNAVVVGSKFDSVLMDDDKFDNFVKAIRFTSDKLNKHAQAIIDGELRENSNNKILQSIKSNLPPKYISPMAYSIGMKEKQNLTANEEHVLRQLENRFKSFNFTSEMLKDFSYIAHLKENELNNFKANKYKIMEEKVEDLVNGQLAFLKKTLNDLRVEVENKKQILSEEEVESLNNKLFEIKQKGQNIEFKIRDVFDTEVINTEKLIKKMCIDIQSKIIDYDNLRVETRTETREEKEAFFIFFEKTREYETVIKEATLKEVGEHIRAYSLAIKNSILENITKIIDIDGLKQKVKGMLLKSLEIEENTLQAENILLLIDSKLKKLTTISIDIDIDSYEKMVGDEFSNKYKPGFDDEVTLARGEQIHYLALVQRETLIKVANDIERELLAYIKVMTESYKELGENLLGNVLAKIEKNTNIILENMKDKQLYIKKYDDIDEILKEIMVNV